MAAPSAASRVRESPTQRMGTAAHPAFLRGAKTLLLLRLDGEQSCGIHEELRHDPDGRAAFHVISVDALSPAARAGITEGDELLTVQVLGVDRSPFAWSDTALERLEHLEEITVVQICVKKAEDSRVSEPQQRRHDYIAQWLTKAKMLKIASKRFRGAFILAQLQKVVVLMYDFEFDNYARLWKALTDDERKAFALPMARAFVSETKLPGLVDEVREPPRPPSPPGSITSRPPSLTSPPPSSKMSDMSTTESQVWSQRSSLHEYGKSEPPPSPPRSSGQGDDADSVASRQSSATTHRYLPYTKTPQRMASLFSVPPRHVNQKRPAKRRATYDSYESKSESESEEEEEWVPSGVRGGRAMVKREPSMW